MLALGSWCVSEGVDIVSRAQSSTLSKGLAASPSLMLLLAALRSGDTTFAINALCGSISVACTLVLGMCIVIGTTQNRSHALQLEKTLRAHGRILAFTVPLIVCILVDGFCLSFALIGLCEFVVFSWYAFIGSKSQVASKGKDSIDLDGRAVDEPVAKGMLFVVLGVLIVWLYSDDMVIFFHKASDLYLVEIGHLAFFLAPFALQLSDIIACLKLSESGKRDSSNLAIQYVLGNTVSCSTLLLGILCLYGYYNHIHWAPSFSASFLIMASTSLAAAVVIWMPAVLNRNHGFILIVLYGLAIFIHLFMDSTFLAPQISANLSLRSVDIGTVSQSATRDVISEISLTPFL